MEFQLQPNQNPVTWCLRVRSTSNEWIMMSICSREEWKVCVIGKRHPHLKVERLILVLCLVISMPSSMLSREVVTCDRVGTPYRNIEINAIKKVSPEYPREPGVRVEGTVKVQVLVDRRGNVASARALCGHPLLFASSVKAARSWKFKPLHINGRRYKTTGIISFHFSEPAKITR